MKKLFFVLISLGLLACNGRVDPNDTPVAKVFDDVLYQSDLQGKVPEGIALEDSVQIARNFIDKWIRIKLLLHQAELNLTEEDQNVELQIEDYRSSLLIYKYEQNFINQKLDTNISDESIEEYYNEFSSNFVLKNNLIQGMYIKVPRSAPKTWKVRNWYMSKKPEHLKELEEYCFANSAEFDYFDEGWKYFSKIVEKMPRLYSKPESILRNRKFYETRDTSYIYFLKIGDYRLPGAVEPLPLVKQNIKSILLNKRKIKIVQELEANIYNDALNHSNFTVYE